MVYLREEAGEADLERQKGLIEYLRENWGGGRGEGRARREEGDKVARTEI